VELQRLFVVLFINKHWPIQGGQSGHGPRPVCQWDLATQPAKILHGLMGTEQFMVHIILIYM